MTGLVPARVLVAVALTYVPMVVEALYSRRQERRLRARGAVEPADDVHGVMTWAYPVAFLVMAADGWWQARDVDGTFHLGLITWTVGKGLKYWAIATLGPYWSFRVLVLPGAPLVTRGPYRYLRHPNYVAAVGELVAMALLAFAPVGGLLGTLGFAWLLRRRIRVEERALGPRPARAAGRPRARL